MRETLTRKAFRAVGPQVVEKQFISDGEMLPEGWHDTIEAALKCWQNATSVVESQHSELMPASPLTSESAPKKRGRPRNATSV